MSAIAGIDFSTKAIDVVLVDEDTGHADWHRFNLDAYGDAFDRARWIRDAMPARGWWNDHGVIACGIEQPRGNYGVTPLFRVQGAVLACLPTTLLVQPWNPSSWRKAVGLVGNATKTDVMRHVVETAPTFTTAANLLPQDACDALCIAWATRSVLEQVAA